MDHLHLHVVGPKPSFEKECCSKWCRKSHSPHQVITVHHSFTSPKCPLRPSDFPLVAGVVCAGYPLGSALSTENRPQCVRHSLASTSYWNPPPVPFSPRLSSPPLTPTSSIASDLPFHAVASPPWPAPRRILSRVVSSPTASPWSPSIGPKPSMPWIWVHSFFPPYFSVYSSYSVLFGSVLELIREVISLHIQVRTREKIRENFRSIRRLYDLFYHPKRELTAEWLLVRVIIASSSCCGEFW